MAYATISDVQALNANRVFTATSVPNIAQVGEYLALTAIELDSIMAGRQYGLPIPTTATNALGLLQLLNAKGAYALAETAAPQSPFRKDAAAAWECVKQDLMTGRLDPIDAPAAPPQSLFRASEKDRPYFYGRCQRF